MAPNNPNILSIWFTMEISQTAMVDVMVVETDLHLNTRHPEYDGVAVDTLLSDARQFLAKSAAPGTNLRLMSIRSDQV